MTAHTVLCLQHTYAHFVPCSQFILCFHNVLLLPFVGIFVRFPHNFRMIMQHHKNVCFPIVCLNFDIFIRQWKMIESHCQIHKHNTTRVYTPNTPFTVFNTPSNKRWDAMRRNGNVGWWCVQLHMAQELAFLFRSIWMAMWRGSKKSNVAHICLAPYTYTT